MKKSTKCTYGLIIGRFQPFHNAHLKLILAALERYDRVLVLVGSFRQARDIRNPFTYEERFEMIRSVVKDERVSFAPVRDFYYNENAWLVEIQRIVYDIVGAAEVYLLGHTRDSSSYYLRAFPQWGFQDVGVFENDISASDIRAAFLTTNIDNPELTPTILRSKLPTAVVGFMESFSETEDYIKLVEEYEFIQKYKAAWKVAPYPVTFVTVDSLVVKSGHVLVVNRKAMPGKGLLALPGGFLQQDEEIVDGAIRELREETRIDVHKKTLKESIVDQRVFSHPLRSLRGRTITHALCISLPSEGPLPQVKGSDDALKARWLSLHEVFASDDKFFEDHWHIVQAFVSRF